MRHQIEVVIDWVEPDERERGRLIEALDLGLKLGEGTVIVRSPIQNKKRQARSNTTNCSHLNMHVHLVVGAFNHRRLSCSASIVLKACVGHAMDSDNCIHSCQSD